MKKWMLVFTIMISSIFMRAQDGISDVLAAGVDAARVFTDSYTRPAAEAFSYNLSSGWYDNATVLKAGQFKVGLRAQATISPDEQQSFLLDPAAYERIIQNNYDRGNNPDADVDVTLADGSNQPRLVATALGENDPAQSLVITTTDALTNVQTSRTVIELPQGLGSAGVDAVPSAFVQASIGLGYGLEIKARFTPRVQIDEAQILVYGGGLQWQVSQLLDQRNLLPVDISLLAAYSKLDADYDFEDGALVDGSDQRLETQSQSVTLAAIAGTKFKVLNFYAGFNYNIGRTETDLLGTYTVRSSTSVFPVSQTFEDPISVSASVSSALGTVGTQLKLGFFEFQADYTFGAYDTVGGAVAFQF
jgi:hypothetical protein